MRAHTVDRLVLPKRMHFPQFEGVYTASAISPDGQIIAVPLNLHALRFPYLADNYVYKGTDIAVIRVRPLLTPRDLAAQKARPGPLRSPLTITREKVTILVYRRNHWDRRELDARLKNLKTEAESPVPIGDFVDAVKPIQLRTGLHTTL